MIARAAGVLCMDAIKSQLGEVQFVDESIDHSDRVVLADVVVEAFWEEDALRSIFTFDEAAHPILRL